MLSRFCCLFALATGIVVFTFIPAFATIINIPDDYATIQEGINASSDGDTVLVDEGQYYERINMYGRNVLLTSEFIIDSDTLHIQNTIIDADTLEIGVVDTGSVVCFVNGEAATSIIQGFTIKDGIGTSISIFHRMGGGIYCSNNSSPTIANNIICDNFSSAGGGISCIENSNPVIINNAIRENEDHGIYTSQSSPTISNNTISLNRAEYGSGIFCGSNSDAVISYNIIRGNYGGLCGGGIFCRESNPLITHNIIFENSTYDWGGGICCDEADPLIIGNTISGNTAYANGGGVFCLNNANPTIMNTIIWANSPRNVGLRSGGSPIITYSNIRGGWEGEGNIDIDPLFLSAYEGNYNICSQSPCIDTGDPGITDPDGTNSDIGMFFPDHPDCDIGKCLFVSTSGNDTTGDGSQQNPFGTIQHTIDVSLSSDTVIVDNGIYLENVVVNSKSILLASNFILYGDTLDIHNTVIDGNSDSTAVVFTTCDSNTAIIGFTIRNGRGWFGGGIYSNYSDLIISNNIITENISDAVGGGICCQHGSPVIRNNVICQNTAHFGGGIESYYSNAITISSNFVSGNSAVRGGGIYTSNLGSGSAISNNLFIGNTASQYGGGVAFFGISCSVINNTFSENIAVNGGAMYCHYSDVDIINTIFWADSAQSANPEIYIDENSSASITFCDIQGGWDGEGNIDADPLFRDSENSDFYLQPGSPCIDAGDPNSPDDPDSTIADIGALYFDQMVNIDDIVSNLPKYFNLSQNYPNPFNASTVLSYDLPKRSAVAIDIYDILGRKVARLFEGVSPAGSHSVIWHADSFSSGVYFYKIQAEDYLETKKMVLLK